MNVYRKLLILLITLFSLTLSGCFHADIGLTVNENGSVHNKYRFTGNGFMQSEINKFKKQFSSKGEIKDVIEGNMRGFEVEYDYSDIETMAKDKDGFATAIKGKNLGVAKKSGWLFDDYRFDFLLEGDGRNAGGMVDDVSIMLTITFPETAKNHNADIATPDGKTLMWNLLTSITTGQDKPMKADFRIYHKSHIMMTAAIAIILLVVAGFLFVRTKKANNVPIATKEGENAVSQINQIPKASIILAAIGILIGAYMFISFKSTPTFTDTDSIAYVKGQDQVQGEDPLLKK